MTTLLIYFWTAFWCQVYGVELPFALAVAHIESGTSVVQFRVGLLANRFYGPFNIHKDFRRRWPDIDTIEGNCRAGVRALRGRDKLRILKRYNPQATQAYLRAVLGARKKYER